MTGLAPVGANYPAPAPTLASIEAFGEKLLDRSWRLRSLYQFVDKGGKKRLFTPNWAQQEIYDNLGYRNIDLKVRQLGITTGYCILWLDTILFNQNISVGIIAHTKDDAKIIFRDKVKFAYENLPPEIKANFPYEKCDAGELLLKNGSGIRVGVSFRSGTVQILHVTEHGYICSRHPLRAEEIKTGAFQAVPQDGIIVIESTAKGRTGDFYDLVQEAQKRPDGGDHDWSLRFLPWWREPTYAIYDDGPFAESQPEREYLDDLEKKIRLRYAAQALSPEQRKWYIRKWRDLGDAVYAEYPSLPEEAFKQSTEGAYYGKLMLDMWLQKRVTRVPIEPGLPVETWWDIGRDTTAIWFVQRLGYEVRCVHYYQNAGEGLPHYAQYLKDWAAANGNVRFGRSIGPHDLRVKEWGADVSRLKSAEKLGIAFEIAPEVSIADGIEAVRRVLPLVVMDEEECGSGIKGMESYRKEWNPVLGVWKDNPLHDFASHPADAFRYGVLAMGNAPVITAAAKSQKRTVVVRRWK